MTRGENPYMRYTMCLMCRVKAAPRYQAKLAYHAEAIRFSCDCTFADRGKMPEVTVPCTACWLRPRSYFRPFTKGELEFILQMKNGHITIAPRSAVIEAGEVGG